ncbi:cellulase-like family protein [Microlunatus soli]|uniref:Sugar-binding cellulase-like n=1 Tax=Microlunatus soli TaxID=630515 RepID=A0A1H1TEZ4_9ACTN|nr:cellulase-like family protein [Microlunatus soli]SDS58546.1 Sugar-binding cellulase-like [Microlunatus soli]
MTVIASDRIRPGLPEKLTITLWDFSWYVRTGPGEPFADLDRAFTDAVHRGYNTIRICAMPLLLFRSGLATEHFRLEPLGGGTPGSGGVGRRTRWYDVAQPTVINAREQLLELFRAARRHDCFVIISSWEYQQSPAFAAEPGWHEALQAIDPEQRPDALADAQADLIDLLIAEGLDDRIAFTELHNEVVTGHLTADLEHRRGPEALIGLKPRLTAAIDRFHDRHPTQPCTVNYAGVPTGAMRGIPDNVDVLVCHPYVYGVLDDLIDTFGIRRPVADFDPAGVAELLQPQAPPFDSWRPAGVDHWKENASIVNRVEMYVHDWCDAEAFDRWLYDHYQVHRIAMRQRLSEWIEVAADWAVGHDVPLVFGEGWVGYTPADGRFEEGPVGAEFCRLAMAESARVGAWGSIVCSNAAPQHAMWADIELQQQCNAIFASVHP